MEEILAPLKKLSFEYSKDPVGVTERELSYLTNFPELPTVEISDNLQSVFNSIDHDVAIEQRDLTREIHFSMMQMAELTKKMADMSEIAAESAEKTTKLTLLIYILTGASIIIGLTGLAINSATAIFSENPESLTSAVLTCWIGGSIATLIVIGSMLFTFKRKKTPKSKITKSNSASEPPKTP